MTQESLFVRWFREAGPYIPAHHGRTFVIYFSGEAIADQNFRRTIHDFAILSSLGIRLVLVHGIRPQVEEGLRARNLDSRFHKGIRITDRDALQCVKEAVGSIRVEIETLLSMGLSNSPLVGAKTRVCTGNFVTAKPLGVKDGIDYCYSGEIRRIDQDSIQEKLGSNNIILISPIGYSPTGEIFNLCAEHLATGIAVEMNADKLIFLAEDPMPLGPPEDPIRQLTTTEVKDLLHRPNGLSPTTRSYLEHATVACEAEVARVHLIDRRADGVIFAELFTRNGYGTLISSAPFETTRKATLRDVAGILELITPLEQDGVLKKRSREVLETDISCFTVIDRDGLIVGCAALYPLSDDHTAELSCIALHEQYRSQSRGTYLLEHIEKSARSQGYTQIFVFTTQTADWFLERGFLNTELSSLPPEKQRLYNFNRNSKVLVKKI